jgi:hypothetical protein
MTLLNYYKLVLEQFENNNYKIIRKNSSIEIPIINNKNIHNETLNYLIYEYMEDHKDKRRMNIFEYFLKPNNIGNDTNINFDFNSITFDDFFDFMISIKT